MRPLPIRAWHICIAGFLQDESRLTGLLGLWRRLHQDHAAPDVRVELRTWDCDWSALASCIHLLRSEREPPRVNIFGYSWGGFSATVLARELGRRGVEVENLVLADAVYRHAYWAGNWRALVPWSEILVPPNVHRVRWFRQSRGLPMGHNVVAEDPEKTAVDRPVLATVEHAFMDELPEFWQVCRAAAWSVGRKVGGDVWPEAA